MWFDRAMNAEEIAERIRAAARSSRSLRPLPSDIQGAADVAILQTLHDVWNVDLAPRQRWPGRITRPLKRVVRRLLAPTLARQIEFNAAAARLARHTGEQLEALAERQEELRSVLAVQADELRALRESLRSRSP